MQMIHLHSFPIFDSTHPLSESRFAIYFKAENGPNQGGFVAIDNVNYGDADSGTNCEIAPPEAHPGYVPSTCTDEEFECIDRSCIPTVRS
jgi:hypothetical protein